MISAPRPPMASTTSCGTAFTVAAVPTGINTGVCTTPWGSVSTPQRPPSAHVAPTSKRSDIAPHSICYYSALLRRLRLRRRRLRCRSCLRRWCGRRLRCDQDVPVLVIERTNLQVLEILLHVFQVFGVERENVGSRRGIHKWHTVDPDLHVRKRFRVHHRDRRQSVQPRQHREEPQLALTRPIVFANRVNERELLRFDRNNRRLPHSVRAPLAADIGT